MIIGVIGSGGREHAICSSLNKSDQVKKIYCFPGNAGTELIAENIKLDTDKGDSVDNVPLKAENFNKIFIEDEAPYRAIMITVEDGQLIRDPLN